MAYAHAHTCDRQICEGRHAPPATWFVRRHDESERRSRNTHIVTSDEPDPRFSKIPAGSVVRALL